MELFAHHREDATGAPTVQQESVAHGRRHLFGLKRGPDGITIEKQELGV
ncbi:hypothetical protein [Burkholderia vietnamiensis]|nr:hypothetical protein [Burkholderia vietnamiensis]